MKGWRDHLKSAAQCYRDAATSLDLGEVDMASRFLRVATYHVEEAMKLRSPAVLTIVPYNAKPSDPEIDAKLKAFLESF